MTVHRLLHTLFFVIVLSVGSLCARAAVTDSLGILSYPFAKDYGFVSDGSDRIRYAVFSLSRPTDVTVVYTQDFTAGSLVILRDEKENILLSMTTDATGSCTHGLSLPAGIYEVYMDYDPGHPVRLTLSGREPDIRHFAKDLGVHDTSFSTDYTVDFSDTLHLHHGRDDYAGMHSSSFRTSRVTNLTLSVRSQGKSPLSLYLLGADGQRMEEAHGTNRVQCAVTELPPGLYYVVSANPSKRKSAVQVSGKLLTEATDIVDTDTSTTHAVIRTYTNSTGTSWTERAVYYDGLGRERELVDKDASPAGTGDLASLKEYDEFGRLCREWLPGFVPNNGGSFVPPAQLTQSVVSSRADDSAPYTETEYESNPVETPTRRLGPGESWHKSGRATVTERLLNSRSVADLSVRHYKASGDRGTMSIRSDGYYADGSLPVGRTTDEDDRVTLVFTDVDGNPVLTRRLLDGGMVDTHYVYDESGDLRAVLPPMASNAMQLDGRTWTESSDIISGYAYLYSYDRRHRPTGRKLPGCEWSETVYDRSDAPVFTRTGEQRKRGEWSFVISDVWGRPCLAGLLRGELPSRDDLPTVTAEYTGTGPFRGYEVTGASLSSPSLLKVNYYDTYAVLSDNPSDFGGLSYTGQNTYYSDYNRSTCKGRLTASVCAVDGRMDSARVCRTYYYDARGDLVQQRTGNHLGGTDTESRAYDFRGNCTSLFQTHITPDGDRKQAEYVYSHDSQGRLLKTTVTYGDDMAHVLSDLSYDSLGRLQSESRCGVDELRTEYTYNVRDWLTGIKGSEFSETLHYTESHNGSQPQYGGNISALEWSEAGKSQGYAYTYDGLSRLTGAVHHDASGRTGDYDTSYSYDLQGNVERLTRHGLLDDRSHGVVDDLTYEYDGNQVLKVTDRAESPYGRKRMHFTDGADAEREYTYDGDGNMVSDLNKGIVSISYNSLNQPMDIVFSDGSRIRYSYASDGTKLSALYHLRLSTSVNGPSSTPDSAGRYVDTRRDYCGDMEYEDGEYRRLNYPGGHIEEDDEGTALYFFDLTDHQGNVRASDMADLASDSHNAYYPFGMFLGEENSHGERRWYNVKELDRTHGLDWYDYVARRYDGMRFTTVDPLAEKYYEVSPYAYCGDNPVNRIDPFGLDYWSTNNPDLIAQFIADFKANRNVKQLYENFEIHMEQTDYMTGLTYNDNSGKYYYNTNRVENGEVVSYAQVFRTTMYGADLAIGVSSFGSAHGLKTEMMNAVMDKNTSTYLKMCNKVGNATSVGSAIISAYDFGRYKSEGGTNTWVYVKDVSDAAFALLPCLSLFPALAAFSPVFFTVSTAYFLIMTGLESKGYINVNKTY